MRSLHAVVRAATTRRAALLPLVAAVAAVATGCGGAIPANDGSRAGVTVESTGLGSILADGRGHTLYLFERDEGGESYCTGACASVWPPFETSGQPQPMAGIPASALGTITRDDGGVQVTYHGHPLYFYAGDASSPGKTKGEDQEQFGSTWYAVGRAGEAVEPKGESGGSNGGGSGGGNGGYGNTGTSSGNGGGGY
jgi:predicted lipoprotein with Yx(FWY)xxD motif